MWSTLLTTIQSSFNRAIQNHEARLADLKGKYNTLQANHNELLGKHNQLLGNYNILVNGHNELVKKHNTLQTNHNELLGKHNTLKQDLQNKYDELKNKLPKRGQCGSTLRSCNA